jgi:hypothetical protein
LRLGDEETVGVGDGFPIEEGSGDCLLCGAGEAIGLLSGEVPGPTV